ncbi:hypothetical protein CAEBREN_31486 [Caenorhabditis brenneri]|uniref:Uncharacterized protein n=1 Tax=Caenorhabditis brenneri TaxID=135651 RepID=G0NBK9_CAEBE|nr:hypothetical protein CAEBREN_31486 [Caenorhabditis brenneri]
MNPFILEDESMLLDETPAPAENPEKHEPEKTPSTDIHQQLLVLEQGIRVLQTGQTALKKQLDSILRQGAEKRKNVEPPTASKKQKLSCPRCQGDHIDLHCRSIPPSEKIALAVSKGLCLNCNGSHQGHCRKPPACKKCQKAHMTSYHC